MTMNQNISKRFRNHKRLLNEPKKGHKVGTVPCADWGMWLKLPTSFQRKFKGSCRYPIKRKQFALYKCLAASL